MASCKYNPGINSVNPYAVLNVTQQSQNVATNKTVVRYELLLYRPSKIVSSASKAYSITINGTKVKSGTTTIGGSGTKSIASGTTEIANNSDGTKSITFSFSLAFNIDWNVGYIGTGTASGSMRLTTIPRATTPKLSPSTQEIGKSITISLPKASSAFTHTLQHDFYANAWTTFATKNVSNSITFTFPTSWIEKIPNSKSGTGRIRCLTYSGNTLIGEKIVNFTATVSAGVEPIINNVYISEAISGIYNKFGGYVQNRSKFSIDIDASGVRGASIKSYKTVIDGLTYGNKLFTSSAITKSGEVQISVSVTDSRGFTTTKVYTVEVLPYAAPRIYMFNVERGNEDGTLNAIGTYAIMKINFLISSMDNKNDHSYKIEYKSNEDEEWILLGTYSEYLFNGIKNGGDILSGSHTYAMRLTVTDYFESVELVYDRIPTASTLFNVNKEGTSICFGGVSKRTMERCYDFLYPIYAKESVLPYEDDNADIGAKDTPFNNGYFKNLHIKGDKLQYDVGDVVEIETYVNGWWTNGGNRIYFSLPIGKSISENVTEIIPNSCSMIARQNGGYCFKSDWQTIALPPQNSWFTSIQRPINTINFIIEFGQVYARENNSPVAIHLKLKFTFQ